MVFLSHKKRIYWSLGFKIWSLITKKKDFERLGYKISHKCEKLSIFSRQHGEGNYSTLSYVIVNITGFFPIIFILISRRKLFRRGRDFSVLTNKALPSPSLKRYKYGYDSKLYKKRIDFCRFFSFKDIQLFLGCHSVPPSLPSNKLSCNNEEISRKY